MLDKYVEPITDILNLKYRLKNNNFKQIILILIIKCELLFFKR
jgi:hypothetical protein